MAKSVISTESVNSMVVAVLVMLYQHTVRLWKVKSLQYLTMFTLYTYEHLGQELHVDKVVQTDICLRATQGQGFNSRKPTLSFAQGRKFPEHILVKDTPKNFYSGVVRCRPKPEKNEIFINIDREPNDILLSEVVKRIKDRHPDEEIHIHLLHCHSNDDMIQLMMH